MKEEKYDEIMGKAENIYRRQDRIDDPYSFHKAFEFAQERSGGKIICPMTSSLRGTRNEEVQLLLNMESINAILATEATRQKFMAWLAEDVRYSLK